MCASQDVDQVIYSAIDEVNRLKRTYLGRDDVGVEILQTISILLNALKRYNKGVQSESSSELSYSMELIKTASDSLIRTIRMLEKKLRGL